MGKLIKILVILGCAFFVWEGYRIYTRAHPASLSVAVKEEASRLTEEIARIHPSRFPSMRKTPKLTIVFVGDGMGKGAIDKISSFLKGGIHFLQSHGSSYLNVFHPHANCSTAQGHASLVTGTFPSYHGMVNNQWLDPSGRVVAAVFDPDIATAGVFNPATDAVYYEGDVSETAQFYYMGGISPRKYKVDTLSDSLVLFSTPEQTTKVFSISSNKEPATLMAGRLGKAFWQDGPTGLFTTSRYFYPQGIPEFVKEFNEAHPVPETFVWEPLYPLGSAAYQFSDAQNYQYSDVFKGSIPVRETFLGKTMHGNLPVFGAQEYIVSPLGIKTVYDFANWLIDTQLGKLGSERLVLWVNHCAYDTLAGILGSQVQDAIDVMYQIDQGIGQVIKHAYQKVDPSDCLFLFCSDEGYYPDVPELLQAKGFDLADRLIADNVPNRSLVDRFNQALGAPYVQTIIPPFVYMKDPLFCSLSGVEQQEMLQKVKTLLLSTPGIKSAWTADELASWPFEREDQGRFFKLHLFRNNPSRDPPQERRSGEVVFQSFPYTFVTTTRADDPEPMFGIGHTSVYDYDAHTSLYVYQLGRFEKQKISEPVLIQQVSISLAEALQVPRPSAASIDIKPLPTP